MSMTADVAALPADAATLAALQGALPGQLPVQGQAALSAQGMVSQVGVGQSLSATSSVSAGTPWNTAISSLMDSGSLVGQTAWMDRASDLADAPAPTTPGAVPYKGLQAKFSAAVAGSAAGPDAAGGAIGASALRNALGKEDKKTSAAEVPGVLASAVAAIASDRRDGGGAAGAAAFARGTSDALSPPPVAGALAEAVAFRSERGGEQASGNQQSYGGASGAEGGMGFSMGDAPIATDGSGVLADPSQVGAEDQIAEQVAYWVHQNTQSAELTIDRDGQPVEVMVSLSGNEAHVTFRSDQAHTREWLDSSAAQLRDLLRGEGLELSGVTVGQSGSDGASGSAGDGRRSAPDRDGPARHAQVQAASGVNGSSVALKSTAASTRALDVFA
ncbi:hypothetical protein AVHM3334_13995 [Acidovorax sp. SUPP3334]|nr:hypothetical protein AVHM3334_13995 [Acidovorax sp. SUPP3334]